MMFGNHECAICGRPATTHVVKKYPAKHKLNMDVCGYHLRPFKTSEFKRTEIIRPETKKRTPGYGLHADLRAPL